MASLASINFDVSYRSDTGGIIERFYVPCLRDSVLYRRAVGYFTSHSLTLAATGVAHLLKNGGRIRLVASPSLTPEDVDAISRGYESRQAIFGRIAARSFQDIHDELCLDRLNALAWLVASGSLDVKLAIRTDSRGQLLRGIYHEKIGIFSDAQSNCVAFIGSSNETEGGLAENFESIEVFWSWDDPQGRVARKVAQFEKLWGESTPGLEVVEFTDIARSILERFKRDKPPDRDFAEDETKIRSDLPRPAPDLRLRDYQEQAINNWLRAGGRGTFKMATGSGKTITALALATKLARNDKIRCLVVVCPYRHLVSQWAREAARFGMAPILAYESRHRWMDELSTRLYNLKVNDGFVAVITTNTTFAGESFQQCIRALPGNSLLVADEAHNFGASQLRELLPEHVRLRLALSATPERWFDDSGTAAIFGYFGPVLEPQFTLRDALACGALVPYRYHPILVELTDDEMVEYERLSRQIAQLWGISEGGEEHPALKTLLGRRARLLGLASGKVAALRQLMADRLDASHMLFYCGDGSVEDEDTSEWVRQVELVCSLLGREMGFRVAPYTAETPLDQREDLRVRLDRGDLQGLVAIRCLDEGVDIPSVRSAVIMASSKNPRQFIQRRGRILRQHSGKDSGDIFDMIVVPPASAIVTEIERKLLRPELVRFVEFADLALNSGQARAVILRIQEQYGLLDI